MLSLLTICSVATFAFAGEDPSDRELTRTWTRMSDGERAEAMEWLRFEVSQLDTLQMRLVRRLVQGEDPETKETARVEETPFFDEEKHAGKRKTRRKVLSRTSSKVRSARKKYLPEADPRRGEPAWTYDWARGVVVSVGAAEDAEHVFRNALAGIPPGLDLARAVCLRALDRGQQRSALTAFGHAYVDRRGNVFPGVTLYDVWASGKKFEVPDADALGIVHTVLDEWGRWSSPIASNEQRSLYAAIEELFSGAHRYRELRESLADVLLLGDPVPISGYDAVRINLHALWVWNEEDPTALARELPDGEGWLAFMEDLPRRGAGDPEALTEASVRWGQLIADGAHIRALLVHVLQGMKGE